MKLYEILIIVVACAFVLGITIWRIVRHAKGKGGCDCGCDCAHCSGCSPQKEEKEKKKI